MKVARFALCLLLPALAHAAQEPDAFRQRCEREMKPRFEVRSRDPGVEVHNTLSSLMLNTRGSYTAPGQAMMGLTASSTRAEIGIDGPALQDQPSGRECIAPRVVVELSYQPLDVYVAREFHPASCSYRQVFAHEMRHVQLYREQLPHIVQRVRDELARRYGERPLYADAGHGLDLLEQQVDGWLRPLLKLEMAKVEVLQRALDSPEETFLLSHGCMGEIAQIMKSSF
jgi:hypothetical protein